MKHKSKVLVGVLAVAMLFLAACGNQAAPDTKDSRTSTSSSAATATTLTVTDSDGEVEVPLNPSKIIVFDMGSLDTINALGQGERVIGTAVTNLPKYLDRFAEVESAGGIKEPDLEKINQLQPDLIIISGRQADFKEELAAIAPTIYLEVDNNQIWESTKANITTLATILGEETLAEEKIAALETEIAEVNAAATKSDAKTLITLVNEGQLSAYGAGSRFGIIHDVFGFPQADDKIEASTHGQSVAYEYILETNPDVIFVVDRTKAIGGDDSENDLSANELVAETSAGKAEKVITLAPDVWYLSGGGLECTSLMLADVKQALD